MSQTGSSGAARRILARRFVALLLVGGMLLTAAAGAQTAGGEILHGFYARMGNDGSPSQTAGNNIYIKFYPDQWLGMLFVPYPYAGAVESPMIARVFANARKQASSSAYIKSRFGLLDEAATIHIERYGHLQDRLAFECGGMSACTIRVGDGYIELIKPGIINEHIVRYLHVPVE